jgi:hypothetical protein
LVVRAGQTKAFGGYLYVDFFDNDGNAVHMLPTQLRQKNAFKPGEEVTLGATKEGGKTGERIYEIGEPFGANLIVAISSSKPLFSPRSEEVEGAENYLAVLASALGAAAKDAPPPVATYTFINTVRKEAGPK